MNNANSTLATNYLEQMAIADAKRLADRLGVSLIALLDASLSLSEERNIVTRHAKSQMEDAGRANPEAAQADDN